HRLADRVRLIEGQVSNDEDDRRPQERRHDVPVRDVDLLDVALRDRLDQVVRDQNGTDREHSLHGPHVFAVLLSAVVDPGQQQDVADDHRQVDQHEADPGERYGEQAPATGLGHDVERQRDERQRGPTPEHRVRVHRTQAPVRQPRQVVHVGRGELDAKVLAYERPDDEPDCGTAQVGEYQVRGLGVLVRHGMDARLANGERAAVVPCQCAAAGNYRGAIGGHVRLSSRSSGVQGAGYVSDHLTRTYASRY